MQIFEDMWISCSMSAYHLSVAQLLPGEVSNGIKTLMFAAINQIEI